MMELTINGTVYQFKFGMGFLREANKLTVVPVQGMPGTTKEIGARYLIASVVVDHRVAEKLERQPAASGG